MTELPLCREPDGVTPCRFAGLCHEARQRLQHYAGLRGRQCWAYDALMDKVTPPKQESVGG